MKKNGEIKKRKYTDWPRQDRKLKTICLENAWGGMHLHNILDPTQKKHGVQLIWSTSTPMFVYLVWSSLRTQV